MRGMRQKGAEVSRPVPSGCVHYWVLEPPSGPVSKGVCQRCGEVQEFRNYIPTPSSWDEVSLKEVAGESDLEFLEEGE